MFNILCPLSRTARLFPHKTALITSDNTLTYEQLNDRTLCIMHHLKNLSLQENDRLAFFSNDKTYFVPFLFACLRMKILFCPLNTYQPKKGVFKQLHKLNATLLISDESFDECPLPIYSTEEFLIPIASDAGPCFHYYPDQISTLLFTSGSSGEPKICQHSIGNHYFSALGANTYLPLNPDAKWLLSLPLYHVGGIAIIFRILLNQSTLVIPHANMPLDKNIAQFSINHLSLIPTQLKQLLESSILPKIIESLKWLLIGGGPILNDLIEEAGKKHIIALKTYGLTEMSSQVATTHPTHINKALILPFRQVKISKDSEILVKGPTLFKGYLNEPLSLQGGYFKTGDLGELKGTDTLSIIGRKDNLFISGGENIQPEEIETILLKLANIIQAVVLSYEDETFGYRPIAFIKSNTPLNPEALKSELEQYLPRFKIPDYFFPFPKELDLALKPGRNYLNKLISEMLPFQL